MKINLLFLIFLTLGILTSCNKKDAAKIYEAKGILQGYDFTLCPCCGGYIIEFENDDTIYRTYSESIATLDDNDFPMEIEFDWTLNNDCAGYMIIEIDDFKILE